MAYMMILTSAKNYESSTMTDASVRAILAIDHI